MTNCNHGSLPEAVYTVKSEAHPTHFVTPTIEAKSVNIAHGALGLVSPNPSWALRFNPGYGCNSQSGNYTILQGIASNQLDLGACGNICAGTRPAITFHNLEPDCHRWAILQQPNVFTVRSALSCNPEISVCSTGPGVGVMLLMPKCPSPIITLANCSSFC